MTRIRSAAFAMATAIALPACATAPETASQHSGPAFVETHSAHNHAETLARIVEGAERRGLTIFAVIDHAAGAAQVGADLRPTTLVIFGNPKGGAPLLQAGQTMGFDLPLKALIAERADGSTVIYTSDVARLAAAHGLGADAIEAASKLTSVAAGLAAEAGAD